MINNCQQFKESQPFTKLSKTVLEVDGFQLGLSLKSTSLYLELLHKDSRKEYMKVLTNSELKTSETNLQPIHIVFDNLIESYRQKKLRVLKNGKIRYSHNNQSEAEIDSFCEIATDQLTQSQWLRKHVLKLTEKVNQIQFIKQQLNQVKQQNAMLIQRIIKIQQKQKILEIENQKLRIITNKQQSNQSELVSAKQIGSLISSISKLKQKVLPLEAAEKYIFIPNQHHPNFKHFLMEGDIISKKDNEFRSIVGVTAFSSTRKQYLSIRLESFSYSSNTFYFGIITEDGKDSEDHPVDSIVLVDFKGLFIKESKVKNLEGLNQGEVATMMVDLPNKQISFYFHDHHLLAADIRLPPNFHAKQLYPYISFESSKDKIRINV